MHFPTGISRADCFFKIQFSSSYVRCLSSKKGRCLFPNTFILPKSLSALFSINVDLSCLALVVSSLPSIKEMAASSSMSSELAESALRAALPTLDGEVMEYLAGVIIEEANQIHTPKDLENIIADLLFMYV
jgi:hypothetical protein